jgi:hypothetical protein
MRGLCPPCPCCRRRGYFPRPVHFPFSIGVLHTGIFHVMRHDPDAILLLCGGVLEFIMPARKKEEKCPFSPKFIPLPTFDSFDFPIIPRPKFHDVWSVPTIPSHQSSIPHVSRLCTSHVTSHSRYDVGSVARLAGDK